VGLIVTAAKATMGMNGTRAKVTGTPTASCGWAFENSQHAMDWVIEPQRLS
jgi:hypothetical protein